MLLREPLVVLVLLLLKFLPLLILLRTELCLLLLVFLIELGIPRIGRSGPFGWGKILDVDRRVRARGTVYRPRSSI
jgi:hypothetical protein